MIVGIVGPSCSGKSFLLNTLQLILGFTVPRGITTRPIRERDNGNLEHVTIEEFHHMQNNGRLSMIAEVFGSLYAYPRLEINSSNSDIAIEIVRENIPELKCYKGIAIKIIPFNFDDGMNRIAQMRKIGMKERMDEFVTDYRDNDYSHFNFVFHNKYNDESRLEFIELIKSI